MRWKCFIFLSAVVGSKIPKSPWLREPETRQDANFFIELENFEKLESHHQLILPKSVTANSQDYLLFHNEEYISIFDAKNGRVNSVFTTVSQFREISLRTFDKIQVRLLGLWQR